MRAPVCFVDTETLGLDADVQPIWELAIIRPDGTEHVYQVKVIPRLIDLAHPKALEISGFTERYNPAKAIEPAHAALLVSSLLDGCHLAGAVVSFDEERLRRLCWAHGQPVTWHYHLIDVEALAVGYLNGREAEGSDEKGFRREQVMPPPWDSTELSKAVGVDPADFEPKHTALADARWAKAVYEAVMAE